MHIISQIPIKLLPHAVGVPQYATEGSAGADLQAAVNETVVINPHTRLLIPTGIALALPPGFEAQIRPRSGLAWKYGITVLNTPGTIDSDYRGEISVLLSNTSDTWFKVERGMRIAQMVIKRYERVPWAVVADLEQTVRGDGGFGSTGV